MSSTDQEHIKKALTIASEIVEQYSDMQIQNEMIEAIRNAIIDGRRRQIESYQAKIDEIKEASGI